MLKNLASLVLPQYREPAMCEACGESFVCGATLSGCWCQEIKLSDEVRAELRTRYERCLCRTCLEGLAEGERIDGEKEEPVSTRTAY
jgi:hypothetical protein